MLTVGHGCSAFKIIVFVILIFSCNCYEKTLRKIVRDQAKMVHRPFSENNEYLKWKTPTNVIPQMFMHPGFAQIKSVFYKTQRPKMSTILSSVETNKGKSTYSKIKIDKRDNWYPYDELTNLTKRLRDKMDIVPEFQLQDSYNISSPLNIAIDTFYQIPQSKFFPNLSEEPFQTDDQKPNSKENSIIISEKPATKESNILVQGIINTRNNIDVPKANDAQDFAIDSLDSDMEKADFIIEEITTKANVYKFNSDLPESHYSCNAILETKADIDFQMKFSNIDIEPPWAVKTNFWNYIYQNRYESLMRSLDWPALKVILIPRTHVDTIWKKSFEEMHNGTVRKIISNVVKKLQFYSNLTFAWNEVSHLSQWWKTASQKNRAGLRRLIKEDRLEITTGGWVETDEATSHLFGILHQFIEGHQWLQYNLNYSPKVAWITNSVTHSPTLTYIFSASDITNLVITNIHFSLQEYLAEYQYSDFVWMQNWDSDNTAESELNKALNKIGNERFPKHSVLTHFLPFNSGGLKACGPESDVCLNEFDFAKRNKHLDINSYNIKNRSEILLEQYSKTGTLSPHNIIMAPIGGPFRYESQNEFDYQYNNYKKIVDYFNAHQHIYNASLGFGTPSIYFRSILENHKIYPTVKGDLVNFADITTGTPAYWTGFFTSRPHLKILLRRLHSTLRSTEILFSFALSYNVFRTYINLSDLFKKLLNAREVVARLQDRNVVSGTLTGKALKYVQSEILITTKDCWFIQEVAASFLSSTPKKNTTYLEKFTFREGEFVSGFKFILPGDQIYIFNSLTHERTEIVEIISRQHNLRILDHNKRDIPIQINPIWKYNSDNIIVISRQFYKIIFTVVIPPMALSLYKISDTYDQSYSASTVYCIACIIEKMDTSSTVPFHIQPLETGDIQIENYKHRLTFDEFSGFLKTVVEKSTSRKKRVLVDYGAFKSSNINSGMFLFKANVTRPLVDILMPHRTGAISKILIIISGQITTEVTSIYGKLLQHTVKIYNLLHTPLDDVIIIESKIDYEISPKNRELEIFMSIQTDIENGNPPQLYTDNNGFQYTLRTINIRRRIESNMYPITSMLFIQDRTSRFTLLSDHAQGVTALQEGQLVIMLDRRVLYNDNRGTGEGLADNGPTIHTHYILLENLNEVDTFDRKSKFLMGLPSLSAIYLSNTLNYNLDLYFVDRNRSSLLYYAFLPMIKSSLPCDISIINYRIVLNSGFPDKYVPNTALLTLHRHSFSCQISYENNLNCNGDSTFNLMKIFHGLKEIFQTNLVGTSKGVPVKILNLANFPSMEITTLRIHF